VLTTFYANSPQRLVKVHTAKSHDVKFEDRLRSCEDVLLLEEEGIALLACDAGREKWNTVMVS
jgi:arylesterase/paraoxonase